MQWHRSWAQYAQLDSALQTKAGWTNDFDPGPRSYSCCGAYIELQAAVDFLCHACNSYTLWNFSSQTGQRNCASGFFFAYFDASIDQHQSSLSGRLLVFWSNNCTKYRLLPTIPNETSLKASDGGRGYHLMLRVERDHFVKTFFSLKFKHSQDHLQ